MHNASPSRLAVWASALIAERNFPSRCPTSCPLQSPQDSQDGILYITYPPHDCSIVVH